MLVMSGWCGLMKAVGFFSISSKFSFWPIAASEQESSRDHILKARRVFHTSEVTLKTKDD
jgi:hypothetical protein